MFRKLNAIEIAEGALLADIAIVFQLLTLYLPIGGDFFRVLIFIVFAVLVLRRGLYVGVMGMLVALFISAIVIGPQLVVFMLLEATGGLFLGFTMRHRLSHFLLLLIGITCGALALYSVIFLSTFLLGLPFNTLVRGLHTAYTAAMRLFGVLAVSAGLGVWWQHSLVPLITPLATFGFTYWWGFYYVALWALLCPFVIAIYAVTNSLVRTLGYQVRPFPDGRMHKWMRRFSRSLLKTAVRRRRILKRHGAAKA
ncbi:MAG: hypothetical protein NVS4B1_37000 [Ktedonobacteraceae bacterium]